MGGSCVVLDIGGVLEITPATGWEREWEERLGLERGGVDARMVEAWRTGSVGRMTEEEVYAYAVAELGLDERRLAAFKQDLWSEYLGLPNEELIGYVRGLRGRCRLGILSNSFVGAREREQAAYGFGDLVDEVVYSHEIGVSKPDPRAYEITCERLQVRPADCLFVDDGPACVEGARAAGMRAIRHVDNARTIAAIRAHLSGPPDVGPA